jgi:hypothetical protein
MKEIYFCVSNWIYGLQKEWQKLHRCEGQRVLLIHTMGVPLHNHRLLMSKNNLL